MSDELEELRKRTERGDWNDETTKNDSSNVAFEDILVEASDAVDRGERPKTGFKLLPQKTFTGYS